VSDTLQNKNNILNNNGYWLRIHQNVRRTSQRHWEYYSF